jgi:hypothetical protein
MIVNHPTIRVVKTISETHTVYFHNLGSRITWEIPNLLTQLEDHGADAILAVLEGRMDPKRIQHITRIVGYFSRVASWNRSKVAELRDRRKTPHIVPDGDFKMGGPDVFAQ